MRQIYNEPSGVGLITWGPPVPRRFADQVRVSADGWQCKLCGKAMKPNNAGANSHIAAHVRAVMATSPARETHE